MSARCRLAGPWTIATFSIIVFLLFPVAFPHLLRIPKEQSYHSAAAVCNLLIIPGGVRGASSEQAATLAAMCFTQSRPCYASSLWSLGRGLPRHAPMQMVRYWPLTLLEGDFLRMRFLAPLGWPPGCKMHFLRGCFSSRPRSMPPTNLALSAYRPRTRAMWNDWQQTLACWSPLSLLSPSPCVRALCPTTEW